MPLDHEQGDIAVVQVGNMVKDWIYIDSGAVDTVCPKKFAENSALRETEESKNGHYYLAANCTQIPIYGRKTVKGMADDYSKVQVEMEVADVKKPLMSVRRMTEAGNRVVFEPSGGYIEDVHTGEKLQMRETGGMYMLKMWVQRLFHGQAENS